MSQDHLEMFLGKMRSFHGFNNNPDVICFQSAYKKLCSSIEISPPLRPNCLKLQARLSTCAMYSDIFSVSSRKQTFKANPEFLAEAQQEEEQITAAVLELEQMDCSYYLTDGYAGSSNAYVARNIETKIEANFHCDKCRQVFEENEKVIDCYLSSAVTRRPCRSTFDICATADK